MGENSFIFFISCHNIKLKPLTPKCKNNNNKKKHVERHI